MKKNFKWGIIIILIAGYLFSFRVTFYNPDMIFGVSFDPDYARYLKLDAGKVYQTILDEWQFKYLRLAAPWDRLEEKSGDWNFKELDWQMAEANQRGAKVILAVGNKTPRWPECHEPGWVTKFGQGERMAARERYIETVVNRYKNNPALEMWQVENEPFLPFGKCSRLTSDEFLSELILVKRLDKAHPTLTTDSGELSTWRRTARAANYFGTTLYRVVWNKYVGYISYDWLPMSFYRFKLWLVGRDPQTALVSELQAEPWIPDRAVETTPLAEQFRSLSLERLKKNIAYAAGIGLPRAYLWGAEWWYWLEKQGSPEVADYIQELKKN